MWKLILSIFPSAISHKVKNDATNQDLKCRLCDSEETNEVIFLDKLRDWSKAVTTSMELKDIVKRKRSFEHIEDTLTLIESDDDTFDGGPADDMFLVHRKDVESWRKAVKAVKGHTAKSASALTEELVGSVFSGVKRVDSPVAMDENVNVEGHISASMSSLFCPDHRLPIKNAVFKADSDPKDACVALIDNCVEVFTPSEYAAFIGSVYDLGILLAYHQADQAPTEGDESVLQTSAPRATKNLLRRLQQEHHPRLKDALCSIIEGFPDVPDDPSDYDFFFQQHYPDGICSDEECNKRFDKDQEGNNFTKEVVQLKENLVNLVDFDVGEAGGTNDSTFSLRAFQIEQGADFDSAVSSILGLPRPESSSSSAAADRAYGSLRRSTRKRKTTYPNGHILQEDSIDICADYNIAAIRLFLFQQASVPLNGELTVVIPRAQVENSVDSVVDMTREAVPGDTMRYKAVELPNSWNEKSIKDVVEAAVEGKDLVPKSLLKNHLQSQVFLCWSGPSGGKKTQEETPIPEQGLMDNLIQISNAFDDDSPSDEKKKSTRRATERGFAGTLLHSSSAPSSDETKKSNGGDAGDEEVKENQQVDDTVEVSLGDNEKENVALLNGNHSQATAVKTKSTLGKASCATSATSNQDVVVLDESDDDGPIQQAEKKQQADGSLSVLVSTTQTTDDERRLRSSILNPHEEEIVNSLLTTLSSDADMSSFIHSECREAARWAINSYSGAEHSTVEELTSVALAKYYESQQY